MVGPSSVGCFAPRGTAKLGVCYSFFSRDFSDVPASKSRHNGGMNLHQWRHGGARGAWNGASSGSSLCICLGSLNEALTCQANLSMSSSGTVDSSAHQLGTSHLSAFHHTHLVGWDMGGSGDISLFSSSDISDDPCKKEATSAWSCGGSPKSEALPSDPILLKGISGLAWIS